MSNATSILINVGAATAGAVRNIHDVNRALGDQATAVDGARSAMKKLGPAMRLGIAAGAGAAAAGLFTLAESAIEFGKAALEDQKSVDILANTLGNIPGITQEAIAANEQWIGAMQLATHVADTELRTAISKLALSTGDLATAQQLAMVAADASVASGKNYASVVSAMQKAADGNTASLQRMFPWLDAGSDKVLTLSEAVKQLGDKYKDTAKKAADQDVWKKLQIIWDELKEALGQWLLPLLKKFGDWFKDPKNQQKVQDMIDKVGELSRQIGEKLVPYLEDFLSWVGSEEGREDMRKFAEHMGKMAEAVGSVIGRLDDLMRLVNSLPSNWLLRKIGLIPDFSASPSSSLYLLPPTTGSQSVAPRVGVQNVYATFNLTGTPAENVREFDRYLRRAGNRAAVSVTA